MSGITKNGMVQFRSACDEGAGCVEVAKVDLVAVRDSKDPAGPVLLFTRAEWIDFVAGVKAGEFDSV